MLSAHVRAALLGGERLPQETFGELQALASKLSDQLAAAEQGLSQSKVLGAEQRLSPSKVLAAEQRLSPEQVLGAEQGLSEEQRVAESLRLPRELRLAPAWYVELRVKGA